MFGHLSEVDETNHLLRQTQGEDGELHTIHYQLGKVRSSVAMLGGGGGVILFGVHQEDIIKRIC